MKGTTASHQQPRRAAAPQYRQRRRPQYVGLLDIHYQTIRTGMHGLLQELGHA